MPWRPRVALHLSLTLLCLLLLALPNVAGAHSGAHADVEAAAEQSLPFALDRSAADTGRTKQSFARVHCPGGESAACGCARSWALSQSPPKPAAAGLCAVLPRPRWTSARTAAVAAYIPAAVAALLIHFTGPRAPPHLL